ncbi:Uu.00g090140.m01.CDS01 [Anthostomella pinea]|uniref:Uu.00g090140.m01.CDS01 n=1 Tax=Anthostomella pinea TaxID=933095 RepID=A0AAI8VMX9_9PEZI|nr:Uu.00g090140.m01.CDS01 [Anthostomella pinea]
MKTSAVLLSALAALAQAQLMPIDQIDQIGPIVLAGPIQIPDVKGYLVQQLPFNSAIKAPLDCNTTETYIGSRVLKGWQPTACAAVCNEQSGQKGVSKKCRAFNSYLTYVNGQPFGSVCSMYTVTWGIQHAINNGQAHNGANYTLGYSYLFTNASEPAYP